MWNTDSQNVRSSGYATTYPMMTNAGAKNSGASGLSALRRGAGPRRVWTSGRTTAYLPGASRMAAVTC